MIQQAAAASETLTESGDASADPWLLAGVPDGLKMASYLTADRSPQYRLIVDVLLDEQQHSLTGVAHDELEVLVRERLIGIAGRDTTASLLEQFPLEDRMKQLESWEVVHAWDVRPDRDDDFLRNSTRYQLTSDAAEFHRAFRRLGEDAAESVAATFAPLVLRTQLTAMREGLDRDPATVAEAWAVVRPTLDGMASAAASWQGRLAGALAGATNSNKVTSLQDTLRRYIEMWGAGVDSHSEALASLASELVGGKPAPWRAVALHSLGAQAPEQQLDALVKQYFDTLRTVLSWFGGRNSQARRLRRQMRDAIAPMIRGQRTLAAVGGHVSRRVELLALAGSLERAESDDAAWSLWCAATGLFSARHLPLASPQPAGSAGSVSFWTAEPAPVEARLRKLGPRSQTGRPARIPDRSAGRAAARARAAAEREASARTRKAVLARSGLRLSEWTTLDTAETETLLMLLAAIATSPGRPEQVRKARTGDGRWQLRADPAPPGLPSAVVSTPTGRLVHPDIRLTIRSGDTPELAEVAAPGSIR